MNETSSSMLERTTDRTGTAQRPERVANESVPTSDPLLARDHRLHAAEGRTTFGLSPTGQWLAFLDWAAHAANAPFRGVSLATSAAAQWGRLGRVLLGETAITPPPNDHRFADPAWQTMPFNLIAQGFLLGQEW
jgi:polyhydroxyalkanoate synthase